ncbi:MAG TPA: nicotinate (nicotinamide) nucleotide adenylyltransferase [Bacteroidales bacterium]|nr:nicotinate (nicotinamide) nucleotide adenylyltransferase [Bacteroidales bacterium]
MPDNESFVLMDPAKQNIGLYFGSFNPIHNGHIAIANYLLGTAKMDEVWFVVSPQSPFKQENSLLDDNYRLEMVLLAIKNNKRLRACDIEFTMPKPSYTINTLKALHKKYPSKNFALIMGADNLETFHKWKNFEEIINHHYIYVYPRSHSDKGNVHAHPSVIMIDAPLLDISSTSIREYVRSGKDVGPFLPEKVLEYINKMGFYK